MKPPFIVISDFDGTITTQDLVEALTTRVAEENRDVVNRINRRELDLKTGLNVLFSRLRSQDRPLYEEELRNLARFRSGYQPFRAALTTAKIPFYIVSNGLDFMLEAVINYTAEETTTHCISNKARFDQPHITIEWQYPCTDPCPGGCGLCKHAVVSLLRERHQAPVVYIGDGITDINGAKNADRIYARGTLAQILNNEGLRYTAFDTFYDILGDLFSTEEALDGE